MMWHHGGRSNPHEPRVHCACLKNITLSADEDLIEQARAVARSRRTTLNAAFREWLIQFTARPSRAREIDALMRRLKYVSSGGRRYTRDELNER
jgi:hypothetical protein